MRTAIFVALMSLISAVCSATPHKNDADKSSGEDLRNFKSSDEDLRNFKSSDEDLRDFMSSDEDLLPYRSSEDHLFDFGLKIDKKLNNDIGRITGGSDARYGQFPWQGRLIFFEGNDQYHRCGAVIVNEFWLLTAAHCYIRQKRFVVRVGDHNSHSRDAGEQEFQLDKFIIHESYYEGQYDYDIALIKIKPTSNGRGITFNSYVKTVALADSTTPAAEGTKCWISGWGWLRDGGPSPNVLQAAEVPIYNQNTCKNRFQQIDAILKVTERMICTGYQDKDVDSCPGDSGGPLVCNTRGGYVLQGVTSWGGPCHFPGMPAVYARVSAYLPWIHSKMRK